MYSTRIYVAHKSDLVALFVRICLINTDVVDPDETLVPGFDKSAQSSLAAPCDAYHSTFAHQLNEACRIAPDVR